MTTPYLDAIELPEKTTIWTDEYDWTQTPQSVRETLSGGLVVEYIGGPLDGQPITLDLGWIDKLTLDAIILKRDAVPQTVMTLILPDGREKTVIWRHHEGAPVQVAPVLETNTYDTGSRFQVTLRLMEIS
jgi:hypothetical protein